MQLSKFCVAVLVAGALALTGCGGSSVTDDLDPEVYFVNGSSDSIALNFTMDEILEAGNVSYLGGSGGWIIKEFKDETQQGYDVAVSAVDTGTEFDRIAQVFQQDTSSLIVAIGQRTFAPGEDIKRLRLINFTVNRQQPNGNRCRLIVLHAFNRFPGFNTPAILFKNPGDNPQYQVGPIDYGTNSTLDIDAGTHTFEARRADGEAVYATATQNLNAGVYLVMVTGVESDPDPNRRPRISFISLPTEP